LSFVISVILLELGEKLVGNPRKLSKPMEDFCRFMGARMRNFIKSEQYMYAARASGSLKRTQALTSSQ
jgi:hypothetical protein